MSKPELASPNRAIRAKKIGISIREIWLTSLRQLRDDGDITSVSAGIATALRQCKKGKLPPFDE